MKHRLTLLGLTIYHWGWRSQNQLLVECLGPAVGEMRRQGLVRRFWFDRFDIRGPHVSTLLTVTPDAMPAAREKLSARLEDYLAAHPSMEVLSREELETRHAECRGKGFTEADTYPGFAANNSFCLYEHDTRRYPFTLSAGLPAEDELWDLMDDLAFWAIRQLSENAATAAVRWIAAVARALWIARAEVAEYWRYHATTLILTLEERLKTEEETIFAALPQAVGKSNTANFSRVWEEVESGREVWPHVQRLVEMTLAESDRPEKKRWAPLREVNHIVLSQLGQPVLLQIPLILYAWQRSLPHSRATPGKEAAFL